MELGQFSPLLDAAVQVIAGCLAVLIWLYSYRAYRFLGSPTLLFLSTSFALFAAGLFVQALFTVHAYSTGSRLGVLFIGEGSLIYSVLEFSGYVVLASAYTAGSRADGDAVPLLAAASTTFGSIISFHRLLEYGIQTASIMVLAYALGRLYVDYRKNKTPYTKFVGYGFVFLLIQDVVRVIYLASDFDYLISSVFQLTGFVLIFYALWLASSR